MPDHLAVVRQRRVLRGGLQPGGDDRQRLLVLPGLRQFEPPVDEPGQGVVRGLGVGGVQAERPEVGQQRLVVPVVGLYAFSASTVIWASRCRTRAAT